MSEEESEAIRERVFVDLDLRDSAELGVSYERGTLRIWVWGRRAVGFLSAYAKPIGHAAERAFYFSKEDGSHEFPPPPKAPPSADRQVSIAVSHPPGHYRVRAFVADRPLSREEMLGDVGDAKVAVTQVYDFEVAE